ncbi:thiolase family protein [Rhodococcus sp. NPDC057014]|uniref:thiolase family protein n=1 Tax=Rhodococcus sp. NPDC057014 TaxID=3346000 RepID=UPI003632325C
MTDEELMLDAIVEAINDAGLEKADIDGLAIGTMTLKDDSPAIAEHFGMELNWSMKSDFGGASGLISLFRAKESIEAGSVRAVVTVAGGNRADMPWLQHDASAPPNDYAHRSWILPYGYGGANTFFGLIQQRYMHEYDITLEQLGKISSTFRSHAQLNDAALLREPLSVEDYVNGRLVSDPIRFNDCVMRCAGAAAVVIGVEELAARSDHRPVHIGPYAERISHQASKQTADRIETGFVTIADKIFERYGRDRMDFLQLYDDYPIAIVKTLEDLGFAPRGRGGKFIEEHDISINGDLPINTGGGLLSVGQAAIGGGFVPILEAVEQLRGEAGRRQLAKADVGLVTGIGLLAYGGNLAVTSGAIFGKEPL